MTLETEDLWRQIPHYLTAEPERKILIKNLQELSEGATKGYYIPQNSDPYLGEVLQGDGWRGFQVFSFTSGHRRRICGIVLSNSCDISIKNQRIQLPKVTFAPIVRLDRLEEIFVGHGLSSQQIISRIQAIRSQSITSMFYLPADGPLENEHVALLDDIHSVPVMTLREGTEKLFTLSMAGFYLFVFKLSVHFCRLQENIERRQNTSKAR